MEVTKRNVLLSSLREIAYNSDALPDEVCMNDRFMSDLR